MHPTADLPAIASAPAVNVPPEPTALPATPDDIVVLAATDAMALTRFVRGLGLSDADAEDCAQEALLRLWGAVERGDHIAAPRAWAYRVAYRLAMDVHRHRRRVAHAPPIREGAVAGPDSLVDALVVATALNWLPSRRRQVLHLRYRSGLQFDEIAHVIGITSSAARSHATQALAQLRARLDDAPGGVGLGPVPGSGTRVPGRTSPWEESGSLGPVPGGLRRPAGIDVDPRGRIWVVEAGRDCIAVFGPEGGFLGRWGRSGSGAGELSFRRPFGPVGDIRFRPDGGFYVADNGNRRIQRFDASGRFLMTWGSPGRDPGQFLDPWSVRLDAAGRVYVSDALRNDVQVFTADGGFLYAIGRGGAGPGQLDFQGDAVVAGERVLVADHANRRISSFRLDGTHEETLAEGWLQGPDGLDSGADGTLIVGDTRGARFVVLDADGGVLQSWPGRPWMLRRLPDGRLLTAEDDRVRIHRQATGIAAPDR
ncbi:MAG TPA: sigma-70 family RNA polymerase sigma factor [Candidatus Limnocylindrales bacterium]|nr:sigma-70 family RNA polymerase sigma factor [Candidatus Limnocylindrales bacterium]